MKTLGRYHIDVAPAPAPENGYPAVFHYDDPGSYVKYGHQVFMGSAQRGDPYWTAEIITQTWYQAETVRIPISGAGYGGKFSGPGFDGLWLDMSEIVRPTRDGIHGRETISTQVDLGGGVSALQFDQQGRLATELPPVVQLPIPILLGPLAMPLPGRGAMLAMVQAAARPGTLALITAEEFDQDLHGLEDHLGLRIPADAGATLLPDGDFRYLEVEGDDLQQVAAFYHALQERFPQSVVAARLSLSVNAPATALDLVGQGVAVLHLFGDEVGQDEDSRFLHESLREVHLMLVEHQLRDRVCLVVSGGIAAAAATCCFIWNDFSMLAQTEQESGMVFTGSSL